MPFWHTKALAKIVERIARTVGASNIREKGHIGRTENCARIAQNPCGLRAQPNYKRSRKIDVYISVKKTMIGAS